MKRLVLERFLPGDEHGLCDHGTFGTLDIEGYTFFSLEDEWRDNKLGVSCIPAGVYPVVRTMYHRGGYPTYEITNVPGRSRILFHPGNTEEDTEGCVLLGQTLGVLVVSQDEETGRRNKKLAVLQSRRAFDRFMRRMGGDEGAEIEVRWYNDVRVDE